MSQVTFDEKTHTYTDENGNPLISVTQLLAAVGIAPSYDGVNKAVLAAKAERGTLIHGEISAWLTKGEAGFTKELDSFIRWFEKSDYEFIASESMVHDDIIAGTFDLLLRNKVTGVYKLYDIKTTYEPHLESTSYQTSLYAWKEEEEKGIEVPEVGMLWFDSDGELKDIGLFRQPNSKLERIEDCYLSSELYTEDYTIDSTMAVLANIEEKIANFESMQKALKDKEAELKEKLLKAMEEKGIYRFESDRLLISYAKPSEKAIIDSKRLRAEHPEIAKEYEKVTQVKASVRIKIKEKKQDA